MSEKRSAPNHISREELLQDAKGILEEYAISYGELPSNRIMSVIGKKNRMLEALVDYRAVTDEDMELLRGIAEQDLTLGSVHHTELTALIERLESDE